jgi:hypothetical protein
MNQQDGLFLAHKRHKTMSNAISKIDPSRLRQETPKITPPRFIYAIDEHFKKLAKRLHSARTVLLRLLHDCQVELPAHFSNDRLNSWSDDMGRFIVVAPKV